MAQPLKSRVAVAERAAVVSRVPRDPNAVLHFDFSERAEPELTTARSPRPRSIKDAIIRWLDEQL